MKNIFLIGMPSSGKSILGQALAGLLRYQFLDLDAAIVEAEKMTIPAIFKEKGEPYFRVVESRELRVIKPNSKLIVATGGGAPCFHNNIQFIKENGLSIFLDVSPKELLRRMTSSNKNERPLFDTQNDAALLDTLQQKYQDRLPVYSQADYRIISDAIRISRIIKILERDGLQTRR